MCIMIKFGHRIQVMTEIRFSNDRQRRLPFFLAMEEWVAHNLPEDDYFFAWRVNPTVICGRNQNIFLEVNLPYCRSHNIEVARRRSGGGCVYADMNNYMFSFIAPGDNVDANYNRYTEICRKFLCSLGLPAEVSGRNDLLVNGLKISGNAFYRLHGRSIIHGTMLYDFDAVTMGAAITPSRAKLESKAVKSVPMRVTSLKEQGIDLSLEEFGTTAINYFCNGKGIVLSDENISEIEAIEQRYYDAEYLYGRKAKDGNFICRHERIENAGEFFAEILLSSERTIESISISGDFFSFDDAPSEIEKKLAGVEYNEDAIRNALKDIDIESSIRNIKFEDFIKILT